VTQPKLCVVPVTFREACAFVAKLHRHHKPPRGHKFSIGVIREDTGELCGVAMVGRPVSRAYDNGTTAEVNRTCTDGTANANSALYGAAWRPPRPWATAGSSPSGASMRGAGWRVVAEAAGPRAASPFATCATTRAAAA
jgi:hypothetical protein